MTIPTRKNMGNKSVANDSDNVLDSTPSAPKLSPSGVRRLKSQLSALRTVLGLNVPTILMMLKLVLKSTLI
jgi:hypothetical protein